MYKLFGRCLPVHVPPQGVERALPLCAIEWRGLCVAYCVFAGFTRGRFFGGYGLDLTTWVALYERRAGLAQTKWRARLDQAFSLKLAQNGCHYGQGHSDDASKSTLIKRRVLTTLTLVIRSTLSDGAQHPLHPLWTLPQVGMLGYSLQ
jgi:hypothetical protein